MKTKTNRTLRKILSIALCLALVMSYVPMVSITASAVESTIPVIEGYGFDSDDSEFGDVFINPITSDTSATGTLWSDEAGKGNLSFQWGYGDTLDVTLVEPDGVVTYETSNIQAHSDDSKSSDLHWTEFPLSSAYEDGTYITATRGFDNYTNNDFLANGNGSVANVFTQTASGDPSFLSDDMLMYGESIIENGTTSMSFDHIPATFRFIITNTHEKALSLESVTLRVVDADGTSVPAAAESCNIIIDAENICPELLYGNLAYSTYDSVTTNLSDYTLEAGESYLAYALALPLGNMDTGKCDAAAFEGKTIQVGVTTSEGECIALELEADEIANANPHNAYNWVGGKSYTMHMETRCYDGCAFDTTGKCTVCGYECTHNFDDKGFCSACDAYQPATLNADGYYEISNAGQLYWFARLVNIEGVTDANAILTESVDLKGRVWYPIGLYNDIAEAGGESVRNQYKGTFDGNFHTVSNFTAMGNGSQGLLGWCDYTSANVMNLGICNAVVSGWNAGAVAGYGANLSNCYAVDSTITGSSDSNTAAVTISSLGGNNAASTIKNCYAYNCTLIVSAGEEYVMHPVGGVRTNGMGNVQNTYYGKITTQATLTSTQGAEEKSEAQFKSGEVAYLLQEGNTVQIWGQDNNQTGAKPMFTSNELYKVVTVGETGNYSVANVGDTNGDGTVDVEDYQVLVNKALADDHEQIETASYDDIVKYDLDGDGYLDVIDAYLLHLFINGFTTVDVYAVGDYDLNGVAFEEADIKAIKHAIENPEKLATYKKYASDINGDGKLDENDLTALTAKYGEVTGAECADNVEVYYRWGNKYSTCTATAMCTLCGEKVATETVNTTSETLSESTCTQDGKVKYIAIFENELLGTKSIEIVSKAEGHKYNDGVCTVCGLTMTAEELKAVVAQQLAAGETDIEVTLAPDASAEMITAIRRAICDTEGVTDGSINLTLKGVTSIPGTTNWDGVAFGPGDIYDEAGKIVDQELVTQLASVNLPDVTEIGAQAFYFCENLVSVSAPKAQTIGAQALGYTALTSVEFPELTTIPTDMFSGTWTLSSAKFPKVTTIEQGGLLVGAKFEPENNPTPFPLELTAEGDITFNGSYHFNISEQNYSGKVDLVLCCDKKDAVTFHEDGTATWQVSEDLGYTFKSITFKHSYVDGKCTACGEDCAHTGEATYTLTEDGKQHIAKWSCCDKEVTEDHTGGTATCKELAKCEHCDASYGELDPNNHEYEKNNGICCETYQPAELNESGYYEIGNAGQLFWFAQQVNVEGNKEIRGALTADIDLENKPWTPIGAMGEENSFCGVFDGQNYTIRGLNVEGSENGVGFFGEVRTGTVKNFTIYGEVVVNAEVDYVGGVIGSICGLDSENDLERNGAIIQNITSYVNVTANAHGIGMIGGFVGYADHQSLIEKCSWYGTFDAGEYRVDSGAGGFIGKIQENTSEVTIRNCGAYGTIKTNYAKNSYNNTPTIYMGGFLSFSNTGAKTTLENCLFAGRFEHGENLTDQAFLGAFGTLRSVNAIKNCYYLGDGGLAAVHSDSDLKPGSDNVEITSVTEDDLRNNTIATQLGEYWEQGENYPVIKR